MQTFSPSVRRKLVQLVEELEQAAQEAIRAFAVRAELR
jgi:hypothetical protein